MTDLTRRSALIGAGALAATAAAVVRATTPAAASGARTTVVYTPHPDDETLRLGSYIQYCASRGDRLILVAATDGEATFMAGTLGITGAQVAAIRRVEQGNSWHALTSGKGDAIIRLGLADGGVSQTTMEQVARSMQAAFAPFGVVEHYTACNPTDAHPDHVAVANGVLASSATVVRNSDAPDQPHKGTAYACPNLTIAQQSDAAYSIVGHPSVPDLWDKLRADNYASHVYLA